MAIEWRTVEPLPDGRSKYVASYGDKDIGYVHLRNNLSMEWMWVLLWATSPNSGKDAVTAEQAFREVETRYREFLATTRRPQPSPPVDAGLSRRWSNLPVMAPTPPDEDKLRVEKLSFSSDMRAFEESSDDGGPEEWPTKTVWRVIPRWPFLQRVRGVIVPERPPRG